MIVGKQNASVEEKQIIDDYDAEIAFGPSRLFLFFLVLTRKLQTYFISGGTYTLLLSFIGVSIFSNKMLSLSPIFCRPLVLTINNELALKCLDTTRKTLIAKGLLIHVFVAPTLSDKLKKIKAKRNLLFVWRALNVVLLDLE